MTGEISLRGLTVPVGGVKETIVSAQRATPPAPNRKDDEDIAEDVRDRLWRSYGWKTSTAPSRRRRSRRRLRARRRRSSLRHDRGVDRVTPTGGARQRSRV
ncbi:S16 family serine protease [Roseiarcus fermentans]|uniref:S16 family serine protease n=1 Tax=Roseiarcus fermentans TaxID=1473586 RepID=UPI001AECE991|nr:S16 family serine protease [Roseiarcus fermentans]